METHIAEILPALSAVNDYLLYFLLFVSAFVENVFPPIPGDTITAFGAFLVGAGRLDYFLVYAVTTLGSVCGFVCLVLVGRFLGREFFMGRDYRHLPAERIVHAESWFRKYGSLVVLANRFLPGVRSIISLAAGIARMSLPKVVVMAAVSASIWNLIWIHTGYMLGDNWEVVKDRMSAILRNYNTVMLALMAAATAAIIILHLWRKGRRAPLS